MSTLPFTSATVESSGTLALNRPGAGGVVLTFDAARRPVLRAAARAHVAAAESERRLRLRRLCAPVAPLTADAVVLPFWTPADLLAKRRADLRLASAPLTVPVHFRVNNFCDDLASHEAFVATRDPVQPFDRHAWRRQRMFNSRRPGDDMFVNAALRCADAAAFFGPRDDPAGLRNCLCAWRGADDQLCVAHSAPVGRAHVLKVVACDDAAPDSLRVAYESFGAVFDTPIVGVMLAADNSVVVRTAAQVALVRDPLGRPAAAVDLFDGASFAVALSPHLADELAVLAGDSQISWGCAERMLVCAQDDGEAASVDIAWSDHPRCLYVAGDETVALRDLRRRPSTDRSLWVAPLPQEGDYCERQRVRRVVALPNRARLFFAVTDSRLCLLDERNPTAPVLQRRHLIPGGPSFVGLSTLRQPSAGDGPALLLTVCSRELAEVCVQPLFVESAASVVRFGEEPLRLTEPDKALRWLARHAPRVAFDRCTERRVSAPIRGVAVALGGDDGRLAAFSSTDVGDLFWQPFQFVLPLDTAIAPPLPSFDCGVADVWADFLGGVAPLSTNARLFHETAAAKSPVLNAEERLSAAAAPDFCSATQSAFVEAEGDAAGRLDDINFSLDVYPIAEAVDSVWQAE